MSKSFDQALKKLESWYQKESRILPWREEPTYYRVWISEIMLQQTQVVTVRPYFERFIEKFETVEALANASDQAVMKAREGLGYYSRARNLHKAAKMFVKNGFPSTREEWLEVPGVGPYTAGAILSIAGNQIEPILDGNVERVLCRVKRMSRDRTQLWSESSIWVKRAAELKIKPRIFNQALMETGAIICTTRKPKCEICPLKDICQAKKQNEVALYPPPKPKKKWVHVEEKCFCILTQDQKILLRQGKKGDWRQDLWDFTSSPPKSIEMSRSKNQSVTTRHVVTNHKITRETQVIRLRKTSKQIRLEAHEKWVSIEDIEVPVGSAFRKTFKAIRALLFLESH